MTSTPKGITESDLLRLWQLRTEAAELKAKIERLETRVKDAYEPRKAPYLVATEDGPFLVLNVGTQRRLDTEKATERYPVEDFPEFYETKIKTAAKLAPSLSEEELADIVNVNKTLSIQRSED